MRPATLLVLGVAVWGCGGDARGPDPQAFAQCLRDGGASVELDPPVSDEVGAPDFAPVLTPTTGVAARGELPSGEDFLLFENASDRAEDRGREFARLFGGGRDNVLRRGSGLLVIPAPVPRADRELARRCFEARRR